MGGGQESRSKVQVPMSVIIVSMWISEPWIALRAASGFSLQTPGITHFPLHSR